MTDHIFTNKELEKVILVGLRTPGISDALLNEYLDELAFLAETAGAVPVKRYTQSLPIADNKTFVGKGKLEEVLEGVKVYEANCVIFDDELSPSQLRNLEGILKVRILDRTNLILDIFAQNAKTAAAKTQVELAQYQYLLPRLTRMWTHLERQRGGIGMRGPGETEIETDRRIIRDKIAKLKTDLKKIDKQKSTQRQNRGKMVRVALVGYTNVGKSTLMNTLSKSSVLTENKLFATLDTTVRKVVIGNLPFLMADTVGFIRKLPHHLVDSFKSTLDEVREADILVHVVDISHGGFEQQIQIVNETLRELDKTEKKMLMVFNKIDAFSYSPKDSDDLSPMVQENYSLQDLKKSWMAKDVESVFISAKSKENLNDFKELIYSEVRKIHTARFPYNDFLYPTINFDEADSSNEEET
ncbi:GTP-binding protein HflX [Saccharicrinis carchari]|uniref:GTPase HflX n=1 Tax=Saccharicrinis carchari TaxID=1168039 RepID=A0A521DFN5_SACCC|nr:GTPase HflX [Saccharicrinis carchari]SMO69941.1 GTP-binding protein HflX [Saccharicrinis carchari]